MSNEGRVFALHAWWQYHVDRAELDATWTLRWEAPVPRKRARRPKPAQSAPKEEAPKQSSFDDLRKEFGL